MSQFGFGSTPSSTGNFQFGSTSNPGLNFGAQSAAQPSGSITFGTPVASTAPTQQTGLAFGSAAPSGFQLGTTSSSLFGAPATSTTTFGQQPLNPGIPFTSQPSTGLSFGTQPLQATSTGFSFGTSSTTTSAAPGFSLGTNITTSTPSLFPTTSAGTSTLGASGGLTFGATSAPSLNFGTPAATTAAGLNFGLGSTLSSGAPKTTTSTGFTLGTTSQQSGPTPFSLSTSINTAGSTTSAGLGGVASLTTTTGQTGTSNSKISVNENPVPNEITQLIDSFKTFVKDQKSLSSDVARGSIRPQIKVQEKIEVLNGILTEVEKDLQKNRLLADKLKHDTAQGLHHAEIAQRTNDTPPGFQFENTAPTQYFVDLVNGFEQDLQALRCQIEVTDKHIQSMNNNRALTSQELAGGMRKLLDTFVALAGRLQSVHNQVEAQKEQYLNLRKYLLKDLTNVFASTSKEDASIERTIRMVESSKLAGPGPTPFSSLNSTYISMSQTNQSDKTGIPTYTGSQAAFGSGGTLTTGLSTSNTQGSGALFGNMSFGQQTSADSSFQLQKPPLGSKRGKH